MKKPTKIKMLRRIRLTDNDKKILQFINEHGYCTIDHILLHFGYKQSNAYRIMLRLVEADLLLHQRIYHGKHGFYSLTKRGASHCDMRCWKNIREGTTEHHDILIRLSFELQKRFPEANYITERRLLANKFAQGIGIKGHLPDGLLIFPDNSKVFIEVELSRKGQDRLEAILKDYTKKFEGQVWYFCYPDLMTFITRHTAKRPFIKVYSLEEYNL